MAEPLALEPDHHAKQHVSGNRCYFAPRSVFGPVRAAEEHNLALMCVLVHHSLGYHDIQHDSGLPSFDFGRLE